jgi:hypothetical protein
MEQSDAQLEMELRKSDVVCIVYAVDDEDTLDSGKSSVFCIKLLYFHF